MASSVTRATTPAAASAVDPVDEVNVPVGDPAQERYPGAVDPLPYDWGHQTAGSTKGGPVAGSWAGELFSSSLPEQAQGGGYQDGSWVTGHDAPWNAWDSNAGSPFAPSGAVNPDLHDDDGTGATFAAEHVVPAAIGKLTRHTMVGQTTVRNGTGDQVAKDNQLSPNDRQDLDQQQWHDPNGYDPWEIPYAERPILNNLAYEATPINPTDSQYTPSGYLPDRSPLDYSAQAYQAPPDPYVGTSGGQSAASDSGIGGGWL